MKTTGLPPAPSPAGTNADVKDTVAAGELRQIIERVERLEEDKKSIGDDIKDVMAEAKGRGYDTKAIKTIVKMRRQDPRERDEQEAVIDLYKAALGMS